MELQVTLSETSLKALISSVNTEISQPSLVTTNVATIMDDPTYGNALVNAIVDQHEARLASGIAEQLDVADIAGQISLRYLAAELDVRDVAEYVSVDLQEVADRIDLSELAGNIDLSDVAENINTDSDEIARLICDRIDTSEVIEGIAENIDLDEVAQNVNMSQLSAKMVHHFVNNAEFRNLFMDALLERLSKA